LLVAGKRGGEVVNLGPCSPDAWCAAGFEMSRLGEEIPEEDDRSRRIKP
jgi:hypothetical protein